MKKKKIPNILISSDTHIPFEREGYLDFLIDMKKQYNCTQIIHVGDLSDNHAINYHEKEMCAPNGVTEIKLTKEKLKAWKKAFPRVKICSGNHDELIYRKARTHGLAFDFFKSMNDIYELPKTWEWADKHHIGNIMFMHGTGFSGKYGHINAMNRLRTNIVMGHLHSVAGVHWSVTEHDRLFALAVGAATDDHAVVFNYGKTNPNKSVIGCGVILNNGTLPIFVPMEL